MPAREGPRLAPLGAVVVVLSLRLLVVFAAATTKKPATEPLKARIVNGDNVDIVDYPFQVSIEKRQHHMCGGAIISAEWVVSARHCFKSPLRASDLAVRAGTTERHFGGTVHAVDKVVNHPGPEGFDYDVAVLHVSSPFTFGQKVQAAPLPAVDNSHFPVKKKLQVTGYGALGEVRLHQGRRLSSRLLKADLEVIEHAQCRDFFRLKARATISDRMICAGSATQDACQGDSGGPLIDTASKLVGVVSFGLGCGHKGYPGVYTNLAHKDIRNFIKNSSGI